MQVREEIANLESLKKQVPDADNAGAHNYFSCKRTYDYPSPNVEEDTFDICVSGTMFHLSKSLLTSVPESALEAMFSGRHEIQKKNGIVHLDRDPEAFSLLI